MFHSLGTLDGTAVGMAAQQIVSRLSWRKILISLIDLARRGRLLRGSWILQGRLYRENANPAMNNPQNPTACPNSLQPSRRTTSGPGFWKK